MRVVGLGLSVLLLGGLALADGLQPWTPPALMSGEYEATPSFTPDGRTLYFMRADPGFARYRLLQSTCTDKGWSPPVPVPFAAAPPAMDADPFVTPDGKRLYFISTRHAPGGDDFDIWHVDRQADGRWGPPQRLPAPVNSPASELLPRLDGQGRLYFGSARSGSSEIHVAEPDPAAPGGWRVTRLDSPVNGEGVEYEAEISRDGHTLVVVADRGDRSHLHLYRRDGDRWAPSGRVPARGDVFQVGPSLSPDGRRLLFAQAHGDRSGEIFLADLSPDADPAWPPRCD
ncbi:TolB family protein [Niveispirillum sp. KHB5.9]|uniref:TolB family protein n=1 Tax=Niveispirillum sp. KHB5.9 TaxID=3400269 RepID=UPI003A847840